MKRWLWLMAPILFAFSGCTRTCGDILLYGCSNQDDGIAVIRVNNGMAYRLAKANELRPPAITANWERRFVALKPILIQSNELLYYIPQKSLSNSTSRLPGGIYRKQLGSAFPPELLLETPDIHNLARQPDCSNIAATTRGGEVILIDLDKRSIRPLSVNGCLSVSWSSKLQRIVATSENGTTIQIVNPLSGLIEKTEQFDYAAIKQVCAIDDKRYAFLNEWKLYMYDKRSPMIHVIKTGELPIVTAICCDESSGIVFGLVPDDNDGRTLFAFDVETGHVRQVLHGVFDDVLSLAGTAIQSTALKQTNKP